MAEYNFPWDGNEKVLAEYSKDNYKIIDTDVKNGKAIVFFSGNGLYYPNDYETFRKTIEEKDRYEWGTIGNSKFIRSHFQRIVFVRDIYKQWYITGVNSEQNTIEKTVELLKNVTEGYGVTCCGVSAGGYMAALAGSMIDADVIIDVSGQWILEENKIYSHLSEENGEGSRYADLKKIINNTDNIFYFYPAKCEQDIAQHRHIENHVENVFAMDVAIHGSLLRQETFPHLLVCDRNELRQYCQFYKGKMIGPEEFFDKVVPTVFKFKYRAAHACQMLKEKIVKSGK